MECQFIHLVPYKLNFILYCFLLLGSFLLLRWNNGSPDATPATSPNNNTGWLWTDVLFLLRIVFGATPMLHHCVERAVFDLEYITKWSA